MQEKNNDTNCIDLVCENLLKRLYENSELNIYDYTVSWYGIEEDHFNNVTKAAYKLVKDKLAVFADTEKTLLEISNYGRYCMLKGGYICFLKNGHNNTSEKHQGKEELLEARLRLTHFRLIGFWLSLILSVLGFAFSIFNFYLLIKGKK